MTDQGQPDRLDEAARAVARDLDPLAPISDGADSRAGDGSFGAFPVDAPAPSDADHAPAVPTDGASGVGTFTPTDGVPAAGAQDAAPDGAGEVAVERATAAVSAPSSPSGSLRPLGRPLRPSVFNTYKERICHVSERLVQAQRPIRILDAVKWGEDVFDAIRATAFREIPEVGPAYYAERRPLPFVASEKRDELAAIEAEAITLLGRDDPLGQILTRNCRQYQSAVSMLEARGTPRFHEVSRELYGSPKDQFGDGKTSLRDLGAVLYEILRGLGGGQLGVEYPQSLSAEECVELLERGFTSYFGEGRIRAILDDGIVSDAAAGADYVKIKRGARFSVRDVEILEVHEGWVHAGTTMNGQAQRICTWLAKGPPCTADVQEGLAVLLEVLSFVSLPARAKRITNRVVAIDKAEDGADLLDVIEFFRTEGLSERECLVSASRVFRGGVATGGAPFTKDIAYCRGFVKNYNFLETCVKLGRAELIPFLFVGKVTLDDVPVLFEASKDGVVDPPVFVPRQFRDLNALAVWLAFSNFLNRIDLTKVQAGLEQTIFEPPHD